MTAMTGRSGRWTPRSVTMAVGALGIGLVLVVLAVLVIVEISYRLQWPDPHRAEFKAFNHSLDFSKREGSTLLALGDSFTAGAESWPFALQTNLGEGWQVLNAGVGGTTITHAERISRLRFRQFHPDVVVYQTYVGNDLLDLRHPLEAKGVGFARQIYWRIVDSGFFAPWFLNHRAAALAALMPSDPEIVEAAVAAPFAVDSYSPRDRWLSRLDPNHVERQILVEGEAMEAAWRQYRRGLSLLVERCRVNEAELVILVIPHCIQVAPVYRERFTAMGARWSGANILDRSPVPFVARVREAVKARVREAVKGQSSVRVVDALPAMQRAERKGIQLYSTNDPHLTPEGSELLAQIVALSIRNGLSKKGPHPPPQ